MTAYSEFQKEKVCYVIGAGEFGDGCPAPRREDLVIAADGGYPACRERGIRIDLILGDFDSLGSRPKDAEAPVITLPVVKDDTDMRAAVREGWRRGFRVFVLYGGAGGPRPSHTLANIQLLAEIAEKGGYGEMAGAGSRYRVIRNGMIRLAPEDYTDLSVFSLSDSAGGVSIRGARYELTDAVLTNRFPLGVSNSFLGGQVEISVREGTLLILEECVRSASTADTAK